MAQPNKIVILSPYPYNFAPGQRFRYEQYLEFLKKEGFTILILSFLSDSVANVLYKKGHYFTKIWGTIAGYFKRIFHLFQIINADFVFIYREASPLGPPIFEWIIAKVLRKKIIYDFDDAIWLSAVSSNNKMIAGLKWHDKVKSICKWSWKISAGNHYLAKNATVFRDGKQEGVVHNPTTIDTLGMHNKIKDQKTDIVTIGWTGSHSTLIYLDELVPILQEIRKKHVLKFRVICNVDPQIQLEGYEFVKWKEETEIEDLFALNIGVMPLTSDKWAEGKCGFKALQYMALGIPAVISPVGVNKDIVQEGVNGYLCDKKEEWINALTTLIEDHNLRQKMGASARETVVNSYSVESNKNNFISLFKIN